MAIVSVGGFQGVNAFSTQNPTGAFMSSVVGPILSSNTKDPQGISLGHQLAIGTGNNVSLTTVPGNAQTTLNMQSSSATNPSTWTHQNIRASLTVPITTSAAAKAGKVMIIGMRLFRRTSGGAATTRSGPPVSIFCSRTEGGSMEYVPTAFTSVADFYIELVIDFSANQTSVYYGGVLAAIMDTFNVQNVMIGCYPGGSNGALTNVFIAAGERVLMEDGYVVIDTEENPTGRLGAITLRQTSSTATTDTVGSFNPTDPSVIATIANKRIDVGRTVLPLVSELVTVESDPGVIKLPALATESVPPGRDLIGVSVTGVASRADPQTPAGVKVQHGTSSGADDLGTVNQQMASVSGGFGQVLYSAEPGILTNEDTYLTISSTR